MKIDGKPTRTITPLADGSGVRIIDQTLLPHRLEFRVLSTLEQALDAIVSMRVRGAPLIGATAAYGLALALKTDASDDGLEIACGRLLASRPTAVNLRWALERMQARLHPLPAGARAEAAWREAAIICEEDVALNEAIGRQGLPLLQAVHRRTGRAVRVMTHCNAGWLATVDWGTALAPVYMAHDAGIPVHVWVSETRPRNQGASLTAWELGRHGVPHTLVVDNAAGHLMRRGEVDLVIVGADRVAANGDVANKIGTYLKALAARDNAVPFYVAVPAPTIDWRLADGGGIPIEARGEEEVTHAWGLSGRGEVESVRLAPGGTSAFNPAFDVTPAPLVTGLITERGIADASSAGLRQLYPERRD